MDLNSPTSLAGGPAYGSDATPRRGRSALWLGGLGLLVLTAAAFVLSYDGLRATALAGGVRPSLAFLYPLIFDGFLVVAFAAALVLRSARLRATWYPWTLIVVLLAAGGGANVLHALGRESLLPPEPTKVVVAAVPLVALGLAFPLWLMMSAYVRGARRLRRPARAHVPSGDGARTPAGGRGEDADIVPGLRDRRPRELEASPVREAEKRTERTGANEPGPAEAPSSREPSREPSSEPSSEPRSAAKPGAAETGATEPGGDAEETRRTPDRVLGSGLPFRHRPTSPAPPPSATPPSGTVRSSPTPPDP